MGYLQEKEISMLNHKLNLKNEELKKLQKENEILKTKYFKLKKIYQSTKNQPKQKIDLTDDFNNILNNIKENTKILKNYK